MIRPTAPRRSRIAASPGLILALALALALAIAAAGCDNATVTPTPGSPAASVTASSGPTASTTASGTPETPAPTVAAEQPSAPPAPVVTPAQLAALAPGALAVTVTDGLRVRSQPRVAADSIKHAPTLPAGTQLIVIGGPVQASGYTWIEVSPVGVALDGGVDAGWVAVADHDGTAWVAPATDPTPGYQLASVKATRTTPGLKDAKAAAAAQNAFGVALYKQMLADPALGLAGKGVVMSPYSIVTALAMARAGAKGRTAAEMDAVLHVPGWDRLGAGLSSLDQRLASRDAAWVGYQNDQHWLALRTANMAFGQQGYPIAPAYLARIASAFGSGLGSVDYIKDANGALQAINGWVKRQTLGRIPELLTPADLTDATRLVLVNAIYLKAEWARPFDPENTANRPFTTAAGRTVTVPTMSQFGDQDIVIAKGNGWRATDLRYAGAGGTRPLEMTLILPDDMHAFEKGLASDTLARVETALAAEHKRVNKVTYPARVQDSCGTYAYDTQLFLPKFGVDTRAGLKDSLKALGMPTAFDPGLADFGAMTTTKEPLYIGAVIHQANIDVDEVGTTAAAATAIEMATGGCTGPSPRTTKALRLNKPFVYVIRDVQTGAILFMGRVMDPSQRS